MASANHHVTVEEGITVRPLETAQEGRWHEFVASSNNGTLFHELDFLAYHEPGRFDTRHLMFFRGETLLGVLPAAVACDPLGQRFFQSPYGASVGGLVVAEDVGIASLLQMIAQLHAYAVGEGLQRIDLRIGPNGYLREPNDLISFGLMACGFELVHRALTFMVPLAPSHDESAETYFSPRQRSYVRAGLRKGLHPREVGLDRLDDFYAMVEETFARHEASPTHRRDELRKLVALVPGRMRLFLCAHGPTEVAGFLVFTLNAQVAYSFYICQATAHRDLRGTVVLFAHLIDKLAGEGYRYLDLGPSISDTHFNQGVCSFKESLGAQGFCRETWRLDCQVPFRQPHVAPP